MGKENNVVIWKECMQTSVTMLYGMTGTFFTTNVRYVHPISKEEVYVPTMPIPAGGEIPIPPLTSALIT